MFFLKDIRFGCCSTCRFNFDGICASHTFIDNVDLYGSSIASMESVYPDGCDEYEVSLDLFCAILDSSNSSLR